ncbi:DVUA0089 family protein [Halotia wernerae UHCC 0503]|nr:DVUA0089 family protein [Halotia wernerae UHCC 0503]
MAIFGTDGSDLLTGTTESDRIFGLAGNDTIIALAGDDQIFGGDGADLIVAGDGIDIIEGGNGNDEIFGDAGNDVIKGGGGIDVINGGDGNDIIKGGNGGDRIFGDAGDDLINGDAGNDVINGGDGADIIFGDAGNDRIFGGFGNDDISGGVGDDQLNGDAGDDLVQGGTGNDIVFGGTGFGNDTLTGGDGADTLIGGAGNDILSGGNGIDRLIGVEPSAPGFEFVFNEVDTLTGGSNRDTFVLGAGTDVYYDNGGNSDYALITDFNINEDVIELPSFTRAVSVAEIDDAGQSLFDTQFIPGGSGTLSSITGIISEINDVDVFQITVGNGQAFSATTVRGADFDTILAVFDSNGSLIDQNDDSSGTLQSTLSTSLNPGTYFLGIASFANFASGSLEDGFTGNGFSSGDYTIALTGVQATPPLSLGVTSVNNVVGTGISFNNDLIALVQGVSISDFSSGFTFV